MATIVTRSGKGVSLTHNEVDANFTNLNTDKAEVSDVILATEKGAASGVAPLDATSKISSTYLPSYVDDVLEYANYAALPATGETGKIYVALDTNKTYRWSGSAYIYITSGAVDSVAGKTGVVTLDKTDVGLSNVSNTAQVTSVTGTSPIISSGGVTPSISISAATTTDAGSMSAADKTKIDAVTGTNTGDETASTIKTKLGITTLSGSNTGDQTITLTGDITGSGSGSFVTTLATITDSGTGTFKKITTNSKGLVTGSVAVAQADITGLLGAGSISNTMLANGAVANLSGTNTGDQVIPVASSTTPAALGTAAVGTGTTFARADHVHTLPSLATLGAQAAGSYVTAGGALGTPSSGTLTNCTFPTLNQNTTGTASNITAYTINQNVGTANAVQHSDITTARAAALTTGYMYYGNTGTKYIGFDGTNFVSSMPMSFNILGSSTSCTGNAATVTNGVYNNGGTYSINVTGSSGSCTGNAATATTATNQSGGTVTSYGNSSFNFSHGQNLKVGLPAANNGAANGDAFLYLWTSEPAATWTGGGIARNMANTNGSFPRVNTNLWGQFIHFEEGGAISFQIENTSGTRYYPLTLTNGNVSSAGSISGTNITSGGNVTGSSTSCTGNAENIVTPTGGYKHLGAWGVGRTAVGAILVNTAYTADYATTSSDSIGNGQTWQNVTASRAKNTTYTNSTGRSIMVNITGSTGTSVPINCDGVQVAWISSATASQLTVSFIVKAGGTYIWASASGTPSVWAELR